MSPDSTDLVRDSYTLGCAIREPMTLYSWQLRRTWFTRSSASLELRPSRIGFMFMWCRRYRPRLIRCRMAGQELGAFKLFGRLWWRPKDVQGPALQ